MKTIEVMRFMSRASRMKYYRAVVRVGGKSVILRRRVVRAAAAEEYGGRVLARYQRLMLAAASVA